LGFSYLIHGSARFFTFQHQDFGIKHYQDSGWDSFYFSGFWKQHFISMGIWDENTSNSLLRTLHLYWLNISISLQSFIPVYL
jgi:hypothetical protein